MGSKAQSEASVRYNRKQDQITLRPDKKTGAAIRQAAATAGQPLQTYVVQACFERMERDGFKPESSDAPDEDN